jgi:hypothetical protein
MHDEIYVYISQIIAQAQRKVASSPVEMSRARNITKFII